MEVEPLPWQVWVMVIVMFVIVIFIWWLCDCFESFEEKVRKYGLPPEYVDRRHESCECEED